MSVDVKTRCDRVERVSEYVLHALPRDEYAGFDAHVDECTECQAEIEALRAVVDRFDAWPTDILRPRPLWGRLVQRIANENGGEPLTAAEPEERWPEKSPWREVAPGISCKLLATDHDAHRVSMLVRLAPGTAYPPHTHIGIEELHLLEGELWIEDRKLTAGDYSCAEPGTRDTRVLSKTGCTCVLVTSYRDRLG